MKLSDILDRITEKYDCSILQKGKSFDLTHLSVCKTQSEELRPDCLYFCINDQCVRVRTPIVLLSVNRGQTLPEGSWLIVCPGAHLLQCAGEINDMFFDEQRHELEFGDMVSLVLERTPLDDFIDRMAEFLDRSLVVIDLSFRVVAYSRSRQISDSLWKRNVSRGFCTYDFIEALKQIFPLSPPPYTSEACLVNCQASVENKLVSKLLYESNLIGYLILLDNEKGLKPYHWEYLPKLSALTVQALRQMPDFRRLFSGTAENVFLGLLDGDDKELATQRALALNINIPSQMRCLVFEPVGKSPYDHSYLRSGLQSLLPGSYTFTYRQEVIALIADEALSQLTAAKDEPPFMKLIKKIGISQTFSSITELKTHYERARRSCEIGGLLGNDHTICYYDDWKFYDIILSCPDQELIVQSIHPALYALHGHDLETGNGLLDTLECYLQNNGNMKQTAQKMYLHRNTLNYRIGKIKELTGLDFDSPDVCFELVYSFRVRRLLHLF